MSEKIRMDLPRQVFDDVTSTEKEDQPIQHVGVPVRDGDMLFFVCMETGREAYYNVEKAIPVKGRYDLHVKRLEPTY